RPRRSGWSRASHSRSGARFCKPGSRDATPQRRARLEGERNRPSPIRGAPSERLSGAGHVRCAAMSALAASTPPRNRAQSARCFLSTALATVLAVACGGAETPPPATPPVAIEAEPPAEPSPEPAPEPTEAASAAPAETPPGDPSAELRTAEVIAQVIKDNRQPF